MKLTGKCKKDFVKYINKNEFHWIKTCLDDELSLDIMDYDLILQLPKSMQYGVYVDFFDSIGVHLDVCINYQTIKNKTILLGYYYELHELGGKHCIEDCDDYKTRQEAREKAIVKVNEIYNESTKETNNNTTY